MAEISPRLDKKNYFQILCFKSKKCEMYFLTLIQSTKEDNRI
jgi:hypothetical protein